MEVNLAFEGVPSNLSAIQTKVMRKLYANSEYKSASIII
jgi:hypothetical protein